MDQGGTTNTWELTWNRCAAIIGEADSGAPVGKRIFGIPRGGVHVAQLLHHHTRCVIVETPEEAEVIVDDIIDSGATRDQWMARTKPSTGFWPLVDRQRLEGARGRWVVFPWEAHDSIASDIDPARRFLQALNVDLGQPGLIETPERMMRGYRELLRGYREDPAEILAKRFESTYDEMVIVRDIEFWSLCEHHVLPFHGRVAVGYIPCDSVVGLSKLARLVHCYSRRLQIQERLTQEICEAIVREINPKGAGVVVEATHQCMAMRGVRSPALMVTTQLARAMKDDPSARSEFLGMVGLDR